MLPIAYLLDICLKLAEAILQLAGLPLKLTGQDMVVPRQAVQIQPVHPFSEYLRLQALSHVVRDKSTFLTNVCQSPRNFC